MTEQRFEWVQEDDALVTCTDAGGLAKVFPASSVLNGKHPWIIWNRRDRGLGRVIKQVGRAVSFKEAQRLAEVALLELMREPSAGANSDFV